MLAIGLIISFLLGFSFLNYLNGRFSIAENIGLSFLLGIFIQSVLMLFIDGVGCRLTVANIWWLSLLVILLLNYKFILRKEKFSLKLNLPDLSAFNLLWLLFIILIVHFEYMNFAKCMFFPTFDRDSLAGFDTIGWVISQEHTLRNLSLFEDNYVDNIHSAGSYITYIPMVQFSYAYVYMLGAETSKIIPALIYLFFLLAFYGSVSRFCGHTGAAVATFFMMITPEMIAFSSLSGTNVINAAYASLGIIYTALWLQNRSNYFLILGAMLVGANIWVRMEGIVFIGAALVVIFVNIFKEKAYKPLFIYAVITMAPLVLWLIYQKIWGIYAEGVVIPYPFWDQEKAGVIWEYFTSHWSNVQFYGLSFILFLITIVANIWFLIKKKDQLNLLSMIILAMVFYMFLLYQLENKWDSIQNVLAYSAKRFLFCYIPLLWCYIVVSHWGNSLFRKLESFLSFK